MDASDPLSVATHGATALVSGGGGAWLINWLRGRAEREAQERAALEAANLRQQLALLQQKLDSMAVVLERHASLGERVALLEASVKAAHERLDGKRRRT